MNEEERKYIADTQFSIPWLRFLGVMSIICSIIAGIIIVAKTEMVGLGLGVMIQSFFLCAICWGVAKAVENSAVVRYNLVEKQRLIEKGGTWKCQNCGENNLSDRDACKICGGGKVVAG